MDTKFQTPKFISTLVPFLFIGMALALIVGLLFMFSYVLVWGLIIGSVLWLISVIKGLLFPNTSKSVLFKKSNGRIIDHNDKK